MADRVPLPFAPDSEGMTFEQYKTRDPLQITSGDTFAAIKDQSFGQTAVGILARNSAVNELSSQGARKLQPDEANKIYPDYPTPWKAPVDPYVAQMTYDRFKDNQKMQDMVAKGPQDLWTKAKNFGAGLLAHALDPIELGAGMIAGWGVGGIVAKTAWGAAASADIAAGTATAATRVGMHAIEGVSGNLIQNTALEVGDQAVGTKEGKPVDTYEGMQQVAINTFFGSLFHIGIKEGGSALTAQANKVSRLLRNTSPEADLALARGAFSQVERGIKPNPDAMLKAIAQETDVRGELPIKPDRFYVPSDQSQALDPARVRPVGEQTGAHIGEGTVKMTNDPNIAAAAANRAMADSPGKVFEVEAKDLNPINIHEPLPENAIEAFKKATDGVVGEKEFANMTPKEMLTKLWDEIDSGKISEDRVKALQEDLKAQGFNSFQGDGRSVFGFEHGAHNDMTVFDHNILKETDSFDATNAPRNDINPDEVQKEVARQQDPGQKLGIDQKVVDKVDQKLLEADQNGTTKTDNLKFLQDSLDAQKEQLENMDKQGLLEPHEQAELEQLNKMEKEPELYKTLAKALGGCIGKHG